jgi:hypothetical protein
LLLAGVVVVVMGLGVNYEAAVVVRAVIAQQVDLH